VKKHKLLRKNITMYGLVFEVMEDWVTKNHGINTWHKIKDRAVCTVKDNSFVEREYYTDDEFYSLVDATSELLHVSEETMLEEYGRYIIMHHFNNGYDELLKCQGSTLRQWLSNLNAMHDHIQRSFPGENFIAPIFWCENCDQEEGAILLHYYTLRGTLLVPMVVGIVEQAAKFFFQIDVKMNRLSLQDVEGSQYTSWRITTVDKSDRWKMSPKEHETDCGTICFDHIELPSNKCPFSGREASSEAPQCPFSQILKNRRSQAQSPPTPTSPTTNTETRLSATTEKPDISYASDPGLSLKSMKHIFPFHVLVDREFCVIQVGEKLPKLLEKDAGLLKGKHIQELVQITRPVMGSSWDWKSLNKLCDQNFFLTPTSKTASLHKKVSMADSIVRFKASMFQVSTDKVMFALTPDASNVSELNNMGLTLSDLPLSSCQRDAIFLGEYVAQEADKAHKLDKLSKQLTNEQHLSSTLLNNMLPKKVVEDLRKGKTVDPAFHEHVTLFFSDIEGFTNMCDQVEPWDVIAMMNQVYSIMDFLAGHFDLYKVETVGDSYMCCSGLPEPDEFHAEKIANFALAVVECVKKVKSPVDGSPICIRIGIHTGSCTSGVVGTLTPHYALFGDMVNTASRHESTGVAGKIQCSSVLYGRLLHFSKADQPLYTFKPRGLVDMKGKGEHYTYWLESGTDANDAASSAALETLSSQVEDMLATNKWKKRRYFRRGGMFRQQFASDLSASGPSSSDSGSQCLSPTDSSQDSYRSTTSSDNDSDDFGLEDELDAILREDDDITPMVIDFSLEETVHWDQLQCKDFSNLSEMESTICEMMLKPLESCIQKSGKRMRLVQDQLQEFVSAIAKVYTAKPNMQKLHYIAEVLLRCNFLWDARDDSNSKSPYALGTNPWDHFVLLFSAFICQVKHTGSTNAILENEQHVVAQMYEGLHSCQQRRSVDFTFTLLEERFEDLYEEITFGCPNFRSLVRKAVLSTDLELESTVHSMLKNCERLNSIVSMDEREARQCNEANIGLILAMATVGVYSQSLDRFLNHLLGQYDQGMKSCDDCHVANFGDSWYYEQGFFMKDVVLPLIQEVLSVLPKATYLEEGATQNIEFWDKKGLDWVAANELKKTKLEVALEDWGSRYQMEKLVSADVDMLESLLGSLVVRRSSSPEDLKGDDFFGNECKTPYEEIRMPLKMKNRVMDTTHPVPQLFRDVRLELREFVATIASGYESNRFHNFFHASHVAHLANLLVNDIHPSDDSNHASGIVNDPITHFAIVLSALVHDVGHTGVPNGGPLVEEELLLADRFRRESIAIDTVWNTLMSDQFKSLQHCLFDSAEEKKRFRQLLENCVKATDSFDQDLRVFRQSRWGKANADIGWPRADNKKGNYKATIVIEYIMKASDVGHAMQDWAIFRQWNGNLFGEMHEAYIEGLAEKDPADTWYKDELWFFDNWAIPLAQHLKDCGALDVVGEELLKQAHCNRIRWEKEGEAIAQDLVEHVHSQKQTSPVGSIASFNTVDTEAVLTSQMVSEVESLSRVMTRYERKMETAVGNLVAVAYKGSQSARELKRKSWPEVHQHLKEQDWYQYYSYEY